MGHRGEKQPSFSPLINKKGGFHVDGANESNRAGPLTERPLLMTPLKINAKKLPKIVKEKRKRGEKLAQKRHLK